MQVTIKTEDGSFRDRANRIYYADETVLRGVNAVALSDWQRLMAEPFFQDLLKEGKVVPTTSAERGGSPAAAVLNDGWAGVLQHQRIPFISYPYEWSFGMLKDAALLQLEILERALEAGWTLKDATAYNIQWVGARPIFIDTTSFEPWRDGDSWVGYRQFCMMFLIPLMLKAYRDVDYTPFLRSNLEGIEPAEAARIFPWTSLLRKGVFTHVWLHPKMQSAFSAHQSGKPAAKIRHSKAMVIGTVQGLRRTVEKLSLKGFSTTWSHYDETHSYDDASYEQKKAFVQKHVGAKLRKRVWDIGCNTGTFSKICSPYADTVLAADGDALAIEKLYQRLKQDSQNKNILPMVMNLANLSPGQGWRGRERKALEERGRPDFLLCLALIHHMVISANIPLADYINWIRSLEADVVIEFVGLEDEMTKQLLRNRVNQYAEYTQDNFETLVAQSFTIIEKLPLKGGLRTLYSLQPK